MKEDTEIEKCLENFNGQNSWIIIHARNQSYTLLDRWTIGEKKQLKKKIHQNYMLKLVEKKE